MNSGLLLKNNNRIMFVDEIDDIMDPLISEFNLMINTSNDIPDKMILFTLIYEIVNEYDKLENKTIEGIKTIFINIHNKYNNNNDINIILTKFINCMFNSDCSDEQINIGTYYLLKKIYISLKSLNKLILNKDYGLSFDKKDSTYYYAQPYSGINTPIKNSLFNDYILTLVLTTHTYLNVQLRDDDIILIINIIISYKGDYKPIMILKNKLLNNLILLDEKINIVKKYLYCDNQLYKILIKLYIINIILNKVEYLNKFINTSFIEILHPAIYKNCIGFTGTAESILIPEINDKLIFGDIYKIEQLNVNAYNSLIMSNDNRKPEFIKLNNEDEIVIKLYSDMIWRMFLVLFIIY
jgi:hypothetical protein